MDNAQMEEIKRHFGVVIEGLESKIQIVAEGISNVDEKLERFRQEFKEEFEEVKSMIKFSYAELDRRVQTLEESVLSLQTRMNRLEAKQG